MSLSIFVLYLSVCKREKNERRGEGEELEGEIYGEEEGDREGEGECVWKPGEKLESILYTMESDLTLAIGLKIIHPYPPSPKNMHLMLKNA